MRTIFTPFFVALTLLGTVRHAAAQPAQFFRISGATATTITAFNPDGTLVWGNGQPGATYTVQTTSTLGGTNWTDYAQLAWPSTPSGNLLTNIIFSFNPPSGMALIPDGVFTMGDTLDDEDDAVPPVTVYVSAVYMEVNIVTYSLWQTVYGWATNHGYAFDHAGAGKSSNNPVESVNWYDTVKWCNARSQQAGLMPVYYTDTNLTQVFTNGTTDNVFPNWTANGYRLPTEAEFEKAERGGLSGLRFPWGNTISESQADYFGSSYSYPYDLGPNGFNAQGGYPGSVDGTLPVGTFAPNNYGLFDMSGNIFEWCWDWYGPYGASTTNPATSSEGSWGYYRSLRGGSWLNTAYNARCAYREESAPAFSSLATGFRCAMKR